MANNSLKWLALLGGLAVGSASVALAQDSGPLIDTLVKKGVLTDQEGEDLRVELLKDFGNSSAGKVGLSSSITEFKISGDVRIREQYETSDALNNAGNATANERQRLRFRFRLNGDAKLQAGWTTGFALESGQASDSGNQTFENGADDYNIFLARAYVGYQLNPSWYFVGGKFKNPFYTTDLLWDSDINPQGLAQNYTYFFEGKDTLEVRAGQLLQDDNTESTSGKSGRDVWLFEQQLVYTKFFGKNSANSFVLAPGYFTYTDGILGGLTNENNYNGTTSNLDIVTFAGEVNFANINGAGTSLKTYWDLAYNTSADDRVHGSFAGNKGYGLAANIDENPLAWLVGVGYFKGQGKVKGDYSLKVDYREIGIGSIDPNINDSDFALSRLNQKGFKLGGSYNLTDFATFNVTYFITERLDSALNTNALATPRQGLSNLDSTNTLQLDLVVKF